MRQKTPGFNGSKDAVCARLTRAWLQEPSAKTCARTCGMWSCRVAQSCERSLSPATSPCKKGPQFSIFPIVVGYLPLYITLYNYMIPYGYLVGGLEHGFYDFPFSWEFHDPNWRTHIFQRVGRPPTTLCWAHSTHRSQTWLLDEGGLHWYEIIQQECLSYQLCRVSFTMFITLPHRRLVDLSSAETTEDTWWQREMYAWTPDLQSAYEIWVNYKDLTTTSP